MISLTEWRWLKRLLKALRIDSNDVSAAIGWYAIGRKIVNEIGEANLSEERVKEYICKKEFADYLRGFELAEYVNEIHIQIRSKEIFEFCHWISGKWIKDHIAFFNELCPNLVSDWSALESQFGYNRVNMFVALHLIIKDAGDLLGTPEIVQVDAFEKFEARKDALTELGLDAEGYCNCWEAVHFSKLETPVKKTSKKIADAIKAYGHYPKAKLLTDVLTVQKNKGLLDGVPNPWETLQKKNRASQMERGFTDDEKLFNTAAYRLINTPPTDIIQALFYSGRDDALFECSYLLNEISTEVRSLKHRIAIVNPSPAFLVAYKEKEGLKIRTTFIVKDETVRDLYRLQFPGHRFFLEHELKKLPDLKIGLLIIMERDYQMGDFSEVFNLCAEDANIIAMVPQVSFSPKGENLSDYFLQRDIYVKKILAVPSQVVQSAPKKKMVIYAKKGAKPVSDKIQLSFSNVDALREYLVVEKRVYSVPCTWLAEGRSLIQMRNAVEKQLNNPNIKHRKAAKVILFSKEISVCYTLFPERKKRFSARAFYRAIPRQEDKFRKYGKRKSPVTEKGLAANNEEDILRRLQEVPFYDGFAPVIIEDILSYYKGSLETLTLKTIWFCCRPQLLGMITYDDVLARKMFCGENQILSNAVPREIGIGVFDEIMQNLISTMGESEQKCWFQLNLIMKNAMAEGFVKYNPVEYCMPVINQRINRELARIRANLSKYMFTDEEEAKIVAFLLEPIGKDDVSRYIKESIWLIGAIRLFTGMPVREICALRWKYFKKIDELNTYQLEVVQYLDTKDQVQPYALYHNRKKLRKVPLSPLLSDMLLQRMGYLQKVHGYLQEELMEYPIILEKESGSSKRKKYTVCSRTMARKVSRELLQKAEIKEDILTLLDGDLRFNTDLNASPRDLFYTNFREKAKRVGGLTEGELCYILGTQPSDTLSEHYIDYANDFLQYDMSRRLNRWSCVYTDPRLSETGTTLCELGAVRSVSHDEARPHATGLAGMSIELIPTDANETGEIEIMVESEHGVHGKLIIYEREGKENA